MINNFQYILILPKSSNTLVVRSGSTVREHSLENIELEYETVDNQDLVDDVRSGYENGRLSCEHTTRMKTVEWDKSSTTQNETINLP